MSSLFKSIIDTEHWANTWNSMTEFYALQLTSSAFDGSAMMQSLTDLDNDPPFHLKSDAHKNQQETSNEKCNSKQLLL